MEKIFENLKELMNFNFSELPAGRSNYITILTKDGLPKLREIQNFEKWRIVSKPAEKIETKILMELTPRWLTITIHEEGKESKKINIECFRQDPKEIIQKIFEF